MGGWSDKEGPRQVVGIVRGPSTVAAGGVDRGAPPVNIFQPPDPTAPVVQDKDVSIYRALLPLPSLLRGVDCDGGWLLDPQGPGSWG
jgi:hypothetical protein